MSSIAKSLLYLIFVTGIVAVAIPYLLFSADTELYAYDAGNLKLAGLLPIAVGMIFLFSSALNFGSVGKGTPAPFDPPKKLVVVGLYRVVRNPMYVGAVLILFGESIVFQSLTAAVYAALFWLIFHLFVVSYEEPKLKKKFGTAYEKYCKAVPRWVPRIM